MRIVFAGTPEFALPCLDRLVRAEFADVVGVVSQPDRPGGRGMKLRPSPVKQAAVDHCIDCITPEHLRGNDAALDWLRRKTPDVLVVLAFGMLLPKSWLDAPGLGAINVHASLLPRWRGAAPIERAMLAGDVETGVCIMRMDEGLDTGPVYAEARIAIGDGMSMGELRRRLSVMGAELLIEALPQIAAGRLNARPQNESMATYASKIRNEERNIDWNMPAAMVDRVVRTFAPKPGARTRAAGRWIKVIEGEILVDGCRLAPGAVKPDSGGMDVGCGEGTCYRIRTLQPEGKKPMGTDAYLRGLRDADALRLG